MPQILTLADRQATELARAGSPPHEVEAVAAESGATPAQVALARLLAKGNDIAPTPGTRRVCRVEENTAADSIELTAEQVSTLNNLSPAAGDRHEEADMRLLGR